MKTVIAIHKLGTDKCSFAKKESEGAWVTFANGSVKEEFLSWTSLKKLAGFQFKEHTHDDSKDSQRTAEAVTG